MKVNKKLMGKKSRAAGSRFELKVRKNLEDKGWIVSKWMNNVEFEEKTEQKLLEMNKINKGICPECESRCGAPDRAGQCCEEKRDSYLFKGKLIPAKHKFRGPGIPMSIGTGFPDFIAFEQLGEGNKAHGIKTGQDYGMPYVVIGVEVKSNGYLDKIEKEKCSWLIDNHIFSKILIASKGKKRGEIIYQEFK